MKIKLPGFIQSFLDIPYALLGFPKNLFCAPKNFKELQKPNIEAEVYDNNKKCD